MDTKRFLFVSADAALITDLAWQVHREGHDVKYYIEAESDREIGDGFVPKTDDWEAEVDRADVIVFDDIWVGSDIGTGGLARELREQGNAVVGGTPNTDRLEEDRGYAMEVLEDNVVNTSETHVFDSFDAGIRHVRENPVRDQAARRGPERQAPTVRRERGRRERCRFTIRIRIRR